MTTFQHIESIVCKGENILPELLRATSNQRDRQFCFSRQLIFFFMRKFTRESLAEIGSHYNKDHATVMHAEETIKNLSCTDKAIASKIALYNAKIRMVMEYKNVNLLVDINKCRKKINECIDNNLPIDENLTETYNRLLQLI
jgi:hypothetical protein